MSWFSPQLSGLLARYQDLQKEKAALPPDVYQITHASILKTLSRIKSAPTTELETFQGEAVLENDPALYAQLYTQFIPCQIAADFSQRSGRELMNAAVQSKSVAVLEKMLTDKSWNSPEGLAGALQIAQNHAPEHPEVFAPALQTIAQRQSEPYFLAALYSAIKDPLVQARVDEHLGAPPSAAQQSQEILLLPEMEGFPASPLECLPRP